jgi:hypothetical protein
MALVPLILQLLQLGIQVIPELASAAQTELDLFQSGSAPTAEQQAAIDAALDRANVALAAAQQGVVPAQDDTPPPPAAA